MLQCASPHSTTFAFVHSPSLVLPVTAHKGHRVGINTGVSYKNPKAPIHRGHALTCTLFFTDLESHENNA